MRTACDRCDEWVQELLDGLEPDGSVLEHLASCPGCRDLYESAVSLRRGLGLLPVPELPVDLEHRVVAAVLSDRRHRQRRRLVAGVAALAASVLLAVLVVEFWPSSASPQPAQPEPFVEAPAEPMPSLRQSVTKAGAAVAELTARRVDEALESTRLIWPKVDTGLLDMDMTSPLESTARPLQSAGQGVSAGLEPVAGQARRALALFVRDLSPGSPASKPGS